MKYFTLDEFACNHCGELPPNGMNPVLLEKLDELRERIGYPIYITSGYRCPIWNADPQVGGVPNSQHVQGTAADCVCNEVTVDELADLAAEIGFDGIGRYYELGFVHLDCRSWGTEPAEYNWIGD